MDYELHISNWRGIAIGASHFHGRVSGQHDPRGRLLSKGCWYDEAGNTLPPYHEWTVEARWSEERYERWADAGFEGEGPTQFSSEADVIEAALFRFLSDEPQPWFEAAVPPVMPGSRLFWGHRPVGDEEIPEEGYGSLLAVKGAGLGSSDLIRARDKFCRRRHREWWRVYQRNCNFSAFSGYHWTPSNYSGIRCLVYDCNRRWRTKAAYVATLPDLLTKGSDS